MSKQLTLIKKDIREALEAEGRYHPSLDPQIDIAAGYALAFKKLTAELENLTSIIVRDTEELDAVPELDECVRVLPTIAENYRKALACIGLAPMVDDSPKTGRPAKAVPVNNDDDELAVLMAKVKGEGQ